MTEFEWLASDEPVRMLSFLTYEPYGRGANKLLASDRKLRLFACACCRQVWDLYDRRCHRAVEAAERYADGEIGSGLLDRRRREAAGSKPIDAWELVYAACERETVTDVTRPRDRLVAPAAQAALLHCLFGNPWRPVGVLQLPHESVGHPWLRWRDGTVPKLARRIYDEHDFAALPVLADALEEAGCPAEEACARCGGRGDVALGLPGEVVGWQTCPGPCRGKGRLRNPLLAHLRGPGPHARGCWALDLVLGLG